MTLKRNGAVIKTVREITIGAALSVALLNGGMMLQSCGGGSSSDDREQAEAPYKGRPVKTYITEMKPGEFKITDEIEVKNASEAGAIVRYFDGRRDTLSVAEAQRLVKTDSTTRDYYNNPNHYHTHHHRSSLSNALLWGGMGYMLGRNNSSNYYNEQRERQYSSGVYANSSVYSRSSSIHNNYHSYRKSVASRPSSSRSGFFSRSGRSFGG